MRPALHVTTSLTLKSDLLPSVLDQAGVEGWNGWLRRVDATCGDSLGAVTEDHQARRIRARGGITVRRP